jgi:hypothetical protein
MLKRLTELLERLAAEFPPGTASLNVYDVPGGQGTVVELRPANPACAGFAVHAEDISDFVDFSFVRATWEFPYERRYRNGEKDIITEIEEMSRAAIAGNCRSGVARSGPPRVFTSASTHTASQTCRCFQFRRLERCAMRRMLASERQKPT